MTISGPSEPAVPPSDPPIVPPTDITHPRAKQVNHTRSSVTLIGLVAGAVILLLLLIFVLQNGDSTQFDFLGFGFHLPLGVAVLLAAIAGALVVALASGVRIVQLRHAYRRALHDRRRK
jgi:uncharacterized integral membrane protein